jgi:hypothetical protein
MTNRYDLDYALDGEKVTKISNRYKHYEQLRRRAIDLAESSIVNLKERYVMPESQDELTRQSIYQMENTCQLLSLALANIDDGSNLENIAQAVKNDRANNDELRRKYGQS